VAEPGVSVIDVSRDLDAAFKIARRVAPAASRRAARAVETILADWCSTAEGPHVGRLTRGGFPVEIVCATWDTTVRYTCDVAGPAVAPEQRTQRAEQILRRLGVERPFPFRDLQGSAPLGWGAWLGGRHTASTDSYKLYVEAPQPLGHRALQELREALGDRRGLLDSHVFTLRLVGCDLTSGDLEFYFRGRTLEPGVLRSLMSLAGAADRHDDLLSLLGDAASGPVRERLPGVQHGFSLAFTSGAAVKAFTFFMFASSMFGNDEMVRRRLLALAERRAWDVRLYESLSAPLACRHDPPSHHGIVSYVIPHGGSLGIAVGLRPSRSAEPIG
jgi:hypothetical protein